MKFLVFESQEQALSVLASVDDVYKNDDGDLIPQTADYFVHVVGEIPVQIDVDEDGVPIFDVLDGYHVNILADVLPDELEPFVIEPPETPYRVFAE